MILRHTNSVLSSCLSEEGLIWLGMQDTISVLISSSFLSLNGYNSFTLLFSRLKSNFATVQTLISLPVIINLTACISSFIFAYSALRNENSFYYKIIFFFLINNQTLFGEEWSLVVSWWTYLCPCIQVDFHGQWFLRVE